MKTKMKTKMKTRSLNKLLILVRDHIQEQEKIEVGICWEIRNLFVICETISYYEKIKLYAFMDNNRPKKGIHYDDSMKDSSFWWPLGQKEPRIAWLNSKIKEK